MTSDTFPDGQDADAQTSTLPRCWLETEPTSEPLRQTESEPSSASWAITASPPHACSILAKRPPAPSSRRDPTHYR